MTSRVAGAGQDDIGNGPRGAPEYGGRPLFARSGRVATEDGEAARLERAGFVVVGKAAVNEGDGWSVVAPRSIEPVPRLRVAWTARAEVAVDAACRQAVAEAARLLDSLGHQLRELHPDPLARVPEVVEAGFRLMALGHVAEQRAIEAALGRAVTLDGVGWYPFVFGLHGRREPLDAEGRGRLQALPAAFTSDVAAWFTRQGVDLLLSPVTIDPPVRRDAMAEPFFALAEVLDHSYRQNAFTIPANAAGLPATPCRCRATPGAAPCPSSSAHRTATTSCSCGSPPSWSAPLPGATV